ncbi:hypothetical protein ACIA8H_29245 [Streptomyces goshikiensis]|uniref:hypothetical protein n=1 Tax=Streptomyces goshikiensis TaxID=1942 RepID=UPI0037A8EADC
MDPLHARLLLAPQALGSAVITPLAGRLTDRHGLRGVVLAGSGSPCSAPSRSS